MASLLSYALTTKEDVKESLGIASSDTSYDNLIIRKINQATIAIERYCGRRFKLTTYTDEAYNGTGTNQLLLKQRPIVGIPSVSVRDTALNEDDFDTVDANLLFTDANAGVLELNFNAVGSWDSYTVTYEAGYSTIPEDLAEACASLAAYYVQNADGSNIGVSEKQEGQRKVRYSDTKATSFSNIMAQLGIDSIINSYANYPISGEG